jgi:hypothetical protein
VEAFVFRLLFLLILRKQLLCAFLSLIFLCGMMPFFVVGVLPMLEMVGVLPMLEMVGVLPMLGMQIYVTQKKSQINICPGQ